jgi:eukaryotic-like serine/threonine-protein kinase
MILTPGSSVGRYEVKSLLGTGGMSEVYVAYDKELCRPVALKLTVQTPDEESLRRFRQEARAASALNHPNILTVYDFGQYGDLHYLVTELISGQTLRQKISQGPIELQDTLEITIQIGTGLKAAHRAGIVHRDIKPDNIIILPDGYVKILDFGLAKLSWQPLFAPTPQASTVSVVDTHAGRIMGTINYMSPEQLRGQKVDQRSDLWSLGVLLFEMLMLRRPFEGESTSDVIAAILERPIPRPADRELPARIWTILEKALSKDCQHRYETAEQFVAELRNAREELPIAEGSEISNDRSFAQDPGAAAINTNPAGQTSAQTHAARTRSHVRFNPMRVLAILSTISLLISAAIYFAKVASRPETTKKSLELKQVLSARDHLSASISRDRRFFAHSQLDENGRQSLRLVQLDAPGSKELIPPIQGIYRGITFTPDGSWIYFTVFGVKENTTSGTLYRISLLGGARQELLQNVDSPVSFAPDGKRFAFFRSLPENSRDQLIIADIEGKNLRVLSERISPQQFFVASTRAALDWSADGKFIASPVGNMGTDGPSMTVAIIDAESGREQTVTKTVWRRVGNTRWLPAGDALLITATESDTDPYQIFRVSLPDGEVSPVYPDLHDYRSISLSTDGRLFAVTTEKSSTLYTTTTNNLTQTVRIGTGLNEEGSMGLSWTPSGELVYVSLESRNLDLWVRGLVPANPHQQLTFQLGADIYPTVSLDGRYIVFVSNRTGTPHLWRINSDGTDLKQLTNGSEESFPQITPDGNWVIYSSRTEGRPSLWMVSIDGGVQTRLSDKLTSWPAISPDGKWIACLTKGDSIEEPLQLAVISFEDLKIHQTFDVPEGIASPELPPVIRWVPDGRGVTYLVSTNGVSNIWVQLLQRKKPSPLTDFTADRIFWFDWSKDGKRIAYARGVLNYKALVIENY